MMFNVKFKLSLDLVMELVEGGNLADYIHNTSVSAGNVREWYISYLSLLRMKFTWLIST